MVLSTVWRKNTKPPILNSSGRGQETLRHWGANCPDWRRINCAGDKCDIDPAQTETETSVKLSPPLTETRSSAAEWVHLGYTARPACELHTRPQLRGDPSTVALFLTSVRNHAIPCIKRTPNTGVSLGFLQTTEVPEDIIKNCSPKNKMSPVVNV